MKIHPIGWAAPLRLILVLTALLAPPAAFCAPAALTPAGPSKSLPTRILGFQGATALYEDLLDDPAKLAATIRLAPGVLRFPGGSIANYYDWRIGQFVIPQHSDSSNYTRMMGRVGRMVARLHPQGVKIGEFADFCREAGAGILIVPNLETSSVPEQTAWFESMTAHGVKPAFVELGNEFWVAMLMDPHVVARFPDVKTAMALMREYEQALRPLLPQAKFAAQAAGSAFKTAQAGGEGRSALMDRMRAWDQGLESADWFEALTVHLYPELEEVAGPGAYSRLKREMDTIFPAMMARVEDGALATFDSMAQRHPGKEIWVTEWNTNGVRFFFTGEKPGLTGLTIHTAIRLSLLILEHPAVTLSTYHMLGFKGGSRQSAYSVFAPDGAGGFRFAGPGLALAWLDEAANGGAALTPIEVQGAKRVASQGLNQGEGFMDARAVLLKKPGLTTLLVHNASPQARTFTLARLGLAGPPDLAQTFATPNPAQDFSTASPPVGEVTVAGGFEVEPYSFTRLIWREKAGGTR